MNPCGTDIVAFGITHPSQDVDIRTPPDAVCSERDSDSYGAVKRTMPVCWVSTSTAPSLATIRPTGLEPERPNA